MCQRPLLFTTELVIGFLQPQYITDEAAGTVDVEFGVMSGGTLEQSVSVDFTFQSGTATGRQRSLEMYL